jgi:hypothetical protein
VYVHAYTTQVALSSGQFGLDNTGTALNFIRNFISQGLGRIAVPLFFLISGYLFFWNFSLTTESYLKKLKIQNPFPADSISVLEFRQSHLDSSDRISPCHTRISFQ